MKVQVQIARSRREYGELIVDAPSVEAAEWRVNQLLTADTDEANDVLNEVSWNSDNDPFDKTVIDAAQDEDDNEADLTVPWAPMEQSHADSCDGVFEPPVLEGSNLWICSTCSFAVTRGQA